MICSELYRIYFTMIQIDRPIQINWKPRILEKTKPIKIVAFFLIFYLFHTNGKAKRASKDLLIVTCIAYLCGIWNVSNSASYQMIHNDRK